MSAPIDDLLFGGDDSGDDDEISTSLPAMRSYSSVSLTSAAITPPGDLLSPTPATSSVMKPLTPSPATLIRPQPLAPTPPGAVNSTNPPTPVKQTAGSGQQMFQQMFALLKQMLPMEQYATLHSEMRKGNGNDIKSIVDIIKRIAGDAIFSSIIQKMDLSRTFPPSNTPGALNAVKTEPGTSAIPTSAAAGRPLASRIMGENAGTMASSSATSLKPTAIAPNTRPIAAAPASLATAMPVTMPASIATSRPSSIQSSGTICTPSTKILVPGVKPEPSSTVATSTSSTSTSSSVAQSRNEALEKIMFAKRLLSHAATCSLAHGVCQVKKCDDVRRVFKHSLSCGGANGCSHCEQLKGLVKYHAKECTVGITDHCSIAFCDALRRAYAQNQAVLAGKAKAAQGEGSDDDDDDNTPLSSSMDKAKKNLKVKSPKNIPNRGVVAQPLKRKGSNSSLTSSGFSSVAPTPTASTTTPGFTASATVRPPQKNVTANMTQEYGRLLQLILHVEKCTTSTCSVGAECAEAKAIMKQMSTPNPPARAKTYKQIYGHFKTCVAKNNTANCPMCKIGLLPILPAPSLTLSHPPIQSMMPPVNTNAVAALSLSEGFNKRGNSAVSPTPRSPIKKPRVNPTSRGKSSVADVAAQFVASELVSQELAHASVADIRKEADVLTHTNIELGTERRIMMEGRVRRARLAEQLPCQKEEWVEMDLFNSDKLRKQMREASRRAGVDLGNQTTEVMAYALHEYLKQVMEDMVEIAKHRGNSQALEALQKVQRMGTMMDPRYGNPLEFSATDILRVSCEDAFSKLRQDDVALRAHLLEEARREEQIEKERAKKRKKVDRSKLHQDERNEAEMDVEELALKDLKERLLKQDKEGIVKVEGRVNESISTTYTPRVADHQVTLEDANYWLLSQKPYIRPKLFVRAEAARIVTKSLL
ncbi:hypothetical protein PsorP6_007785 [Peronosclerospora sorghi]|uniref:Uncharacterized protein n=1 Tax=Peronosclerospora sorghi TaxID=230839 RepID=A0ACC0WA34_9STRA|nr:hypothetical protein PsorP6_007785 [Peronosclerospora sorghi]